MTIPFILLPLYIYPLTTAWNNAVAQIKSYPDVLFDVVININSGPGSDTATHPSSDWITGISDLHRYNNTRLLGYVHTTLATREYSNVTADISAWASWATYTAKNISMDGIFFDEAPDTSTTATLTYMQNATTYARDKLTNDEVTSPIIVFNPGTVVDDSFYSIADYVVAIETTYATYLTLASDTISSTVANKSVVMLHNFTGTVTDQNTTTYNIVSDGIPGVYIDTGNNYTEVSDYWSQFVDTMEDLVANATNTKAQKSAAVASFVYSFRQIAFFMGFVLLYLYVC